MAELILIFVFVFCITALGGALFIWIIKTLKGNSGGRSKEQQTEHTRLIQELYHGLRKMERRVESLETILLDKHRKDR
jgi:phage shock protein B